MRRVLVVAYYFPPLGGIASIRTQRFATHLPRYGWEPTVLAPANGAFHRDPSLSFPASKTVRARSLELSRIAKRVTAAGGSDTEAAEPHGVLAKARDLARRWVYRPDAQVGWFPAAVLAGRKVMKKQRPDVVFSTAAPVTAHLVARRLAKEFDVPWVAEFRDPWSDLLDADDPRRPRAEVTERAMLQQAAAVVAPSPTWSAMFTAKGAHRSTTITNGFDELVPPSPSPDHLVVALLGSLVRTQDLSALWRAAAAHRARGNRITLRFVGSVSAETRDALGNFGLADAVEETGFVPHEESVRAVASASVAVVPGPIRDGVDRGVIPAKTFEYLATDRPILYVGNTQADAATLLAGLEGCFVVSHEDPEAVGAVLNGELRARTDRQAVEQYRRVHLTGRLAEVFDAVTEQRRTRP